MKQFRYILALSLILSQVPFLAFAAPSAGSGPVELTAEQQAGVYGGACSSCHSDPGHPPAPPPPPTRVGTPYWELTNSRQVAYTNPGGSLVRHHNNYSNVPVTTTYSYTERDSFNWSAGGGVPAGILRASLGATYDRSVTVTASAVVRPGYSFKHYIAYPTTRYQHSFTRWQDWSDGSRQSIGSGSAASTTLSTLHGYVSAPL